MANKILGRDTGGFWEEVILVSVNDAIRKGQRVLYISLGIWCLAFFLLFGLVIYLNVQYPNLSLAITVISALVISFIFLYLAWGILVVRWKIWAYKNVENIHAFQRRAENYFLIYSNKRLQKFMEITTAAQSIQLAELELRFLGNEIEESINIHDIVSEEIKVSTLLSTKIVLVISILFALAVGLACLIVNESIIYSLFGVLMIILGVWVFIERVYPASTKFVISEKGILFMPDNLVEWSNIKMVDGYQKFISIEYINSFGQLETKSFDLKDMNKHFLELDDLIKVYRKKYELISTENN